MRQIPPIRDRRLARRTATAFAPEQMVQTGAVEDVAAREGADGAVGLFVLFAAEVAEGLAGPHFFEVVVS